MKLPPQLKQEIGHLRQDCLGPVDLRIARRTKRNHRVQALSPRPAVMDHDRPLVPPRSSAASADVAVPLQNPLPQATKMTSILPPKRVAGGTKAVGEDLLPLASTPPETLNIPAVLSRARSIPWGCCVGQPCARFGRRLSYLRSPGSFMLHPHPLGPNHPRTLGQLLGQSLVTA